MRETYLRLGSIAIEKAENNPLRVVDIDHRNAGDHPLIDVDHAENEQWGVQDDDVVYDCVYVTTSGADDSTRPPKRSYAFPAGRLYRYHCEAALEDDARRVHTQIVLDVLSALLAADWIPSFHNGDPPAAPLEKIVEEAIVSADIDTEVPSEVLLEEAQELAAADQVGPPNQAR